MKYIYSGSVSENGREIAKCWCGETTAPSKAKAISNLIYQFNKQNGKMPFCKITLQIQNIKEIN